MKRLIPVFAVAAALAAPAGAFASTGIVLKVERGVHLVAVTRSGHVQLVHTSHRGLALGQRVAMQSTRLRNGTFAASHMRVVGRTNHVRFRGLVLGRNAHRITLSAGGAILAVKSDDRPKPGSEVDVDADVNDGELDNAQTQTVDQTAPGGSIEGHVVAVSPSSITIGSDEQLLAIAVPSTIDVSKLAVGDEVLAKFSQQPDGSLALTSISADDNLADANDNGGRDDGHGDGGGHSGDGGGGDGGGGDGGGD